MAINTNLPQYFSNPDYTEQEYYQELFNRILTQWFSGSMGFFQPTFDNAQVAVLVALAVPPVAGTHWYNSDLDKMQFMGAANTVQTITSV